MFRFSICKTGVGSLTSTFGCLSSLITRIVLSLSWEMSMRASMIGPAWDVGIENVLDVPKIEAIRPA